jgi:uncharacterized Zn-binding protein involved in type VI secretion
MGKFLIARLGDTSTHGGTIITSAKKTRAEGPLIARLGDILACPIHGPNPIVSNVSVTVPVEGQPAAHTGSVTACNAQIISGAVKTYVP